MENYTRRDLLKNGMAAGVTAASATVLFGKSASAVTNKPINKESDIAILNAALDLEHQGIWAYGTAAPKLSNSEVGKTIITLALRNQADHKAHRDVLASAVKKLGGTPVSAKSSYDLSAYMNAGEGNLDTDANIAKLALALE